MLSKTLILALAVALSLSLANWLKTRQELQEVNAANDSLRKTLGQMAIAIAQKEREINRLVALPCDPQAKPQPGSVAVTARPADAR